uniref:beta-galactosidase n=1 Tax=Solanum tuberosum TaxID=4113 RepID=M0ZWC9_SOLTU
MQKFTNKIVEMMKSENLFESQGGPIILSQIENEYQPEREALGAAGEAYVQWAAQMAVGLNTGVPWVMCKEDDAPDPIINTCNGFYCDEFSPNKPYKPTMWTEAWTGWFTEFGGTIPMRPVQDLAFAVARFIQKGGSFVNYYMFHGGTNFGRTAGGPFITTSYDYDAPIDEYGLIREPKYSHLKEFHRVIKLCESALLSSDPTVVSLGNYQQAHVFSSGKGNCAAFLSNYDSNSAATVVFNNKHFNLPPWSISILPDCSHVAFNTAKVGARTSQVRMTPTVSQLHSWGAYSEDVFSLEDSSTFEAVGLLEQINITRDNSDYLWYITSVDISPSESFLRGGQKPTLNVYSSGHAVHVFVNGKLSGSSYGTRKDTKFTFTGPVDLQAGTNRIELLSIAVGLPVGLKGETMNLISQHGASSIEWIGGAVATQGQQPLKWYKAYFDAPEGNDPVALDMRSMGKGQVWINGQSIGRYWTASANGKCDDFHYAGTYRQTKCQLGCGQPTQKWYHVPRSWLKPTQNLLILFEEIGGDVSRILLVKRTTS